MTQTKPNVAAPLNLEEATRGTRIRHGATNNRRTGAVKIAARFLTAMAIVSLAIVYVATRDNLPEATAATGVINALNVGTCYATDETAFAKGDCMMDGSGTAYDVAGRKDITKADPLYATYAVDPKTSAESPRAILYNGDLIKISIKDQGRDKRTGVLYAVDGGGGAGAPAREALLDDGANDFGTVIARVSGINPPMDDRGTEDDATDDTVTLSNQTTTMFTVGDNGHVKESGEERMALGGGGSVAAMYPIAPIHDDNGHGMKLGKVTLRFRAGQKR